MHVLINKEKVILEEGTKCKDIVNCDEIAIVAGYQLGEEETIKSGDDILIIKKGKMPSKDDLRQMLVARHSEGVADKLAGAKVAICGVGGLGSNIAVMLARSGIGELLIIDYDIVEPTNLNRQAYFISDLGKAKVDATAEQISKINPYCNVLKRQIKLDENNALDELKGYKIVIEAFDRAESKANVISALLTNGECTVIASSGMAGYYTSNSIKTVRKSARLYVCGDGENESRRGNGLMSARVAICAGHQANMAIRLILGEENE